jgi:endoglucanase
MKRTLLLSTMLAAPAAFAQTSGSGSAGGLQYQTLTSPGGCSSATPCQIVEYLHYSGGQNNVAADIQTYFNNTAFWSAHPHTIVVAPQIQTGDWGSGGGVSPNMQAAVAAVKQIEATVPTMTNNVVLTGGSMGGIGTEAGMVAFGPKGTAQAGVFAAGLAYDGALYSDIPAARTALCGVPFTMVHGMADTTVLPGPDQALAQSLAGCQGFKFVPIDGAGHGTWNNPAWQGYANGDVLLNATVSAAAGQPTSGPGAPFTSPSDPAAQAGAPIAKAQQAAFKTVADAANVVGSAACTASNNLLPGGYLITNGAQIVDSAGNPVRIASVGWNQVNGDIPIQVAQIRAYGFNAIRLSWVNATLNEDLARIDSVVAAAKANGLKVILDNHTNEPGHGDRDNWGAQQKNGLWYDQGGASDGTDGGGNPGTVSQARFQQDWVTVARHYAGNDTVIGFDIRNEPLAMPGASTWGGGNPDTDIRLMYSTVGSAIQAAAPGALVIVEGPQRYPDMPWGDLSQAAAHPVTLSVANKLVYSVHDYPKYVAGMPIDSGPAKILLMNAAWGYLVTQNIAPVWIGEMGANFDGSYGGEDIAGSKAWFQTLLDYVSGKNAAQGGPSLSQGQAGISWDWWAWGKLTGQQLEGTMTANGQNPLQKAAVDQLINGTCGKAMAVLRAIPQPASDAVIQAAAAKIPYTPAMSATDTIAPGSAPMTDAAGDTWQISPSGSIMLNGSWVPGGGGTQQVTVKNGVVYGLDSAGKGWFTLDPTRQYWTPSGDPSSQTTAMQPVAMPAQAAAPPVVTPIQPVAARPTGRLPRPRDNGWNRRPGSDE